MSISRPMKAVDADLSLIRYPIIAQPKVDGVRGLVVGNQLRSRTMNSFANMRLMSMKVWPELNNMDFEIMAREFETDFKGNLTAEGLCRVTTSVMNTIVDSRNIRLMIFDDFTNPGDSYRARWTSAFNRLSDLYAKHPGIRENVQMVPLKFINDRRELDKFIEDTLEAGYEGVILRDPDAKYKQNRATQREGSFLRIKPFVDEEAIVTRIFEAMENLNPLELKPDGSNKRSSHQENKIGKGMVGAIEIDYKGRPELIGPGEMTHSDRLRYFNRPELIIGKPITFKHFPYGAKDKLRMATFKNIRENDI